MKEISYTKWTFIMGSILMFGGCANIHTPEWNKPTNETEAEYIHYMKKGTGSLSGQAFLTQNGGGVVKAAGRTVTLDPLTTTGINWWNEAGKYYYNRNFAPPQSENFIKARRTTIADGDGKFEFKGLPSGNYAVSTTVTWQAGYDLQGGVVGQPVEIKDNEETKTILTW